MLMTNQAPTRKSIAKELMLDWKKVKKATAKRVKARAPWLSPSATHVKVKSGNKMFSSSLGQLLQLFKNKKG